MLLNFVATFLETTCAFTVNIWDEVATPSNWKQRCVDSYAEQVPNLIAHASIFLEEHSTWKYVDVHRFPF